MTYEDDDSTHNDVDINVIRDINAFISSARNERKKNFNSVEYYIDPLIFLVTSSTSI